MNKKKVILLLLGALLLRLFIAYFQYSGDLKNHLVWGNSVLFAPLGFYSRHFAGFNDPNYPPLAIILFAIANFLYSVFNASVIWLNNISFFPSLLVPLFGSENMKFLFLKLPAIFSDIGIGYLLYRISLHRKDKNQLLLPIFYLLNPAVIYLSAVWGQTEPITNFFLLLSLYYAFFSKENKSFSPLAFALAALTKQTALWFAPFYLILWWKELGIKQMVVDVFWSIIGFFVFYLPFGLLPLGAIKNYLSTLSGSSSLVSDAAWNIWFFIFPGRVEDSAKIGIFSVRSLSIAILIFALAILLYNLIRNYHRSVLLNYLFLWALLVFFAQTRVHERHLAPALVFCLLTPGLSTRYFLDYFVLSIFHYLNLHQSLNLSFI